jgi:hypothetical protein
MSFNPSLSVGCVDALLQSEACGSGNSYFVQVLNVHQSTTRSGLRKITETISDGYHCLDCSVASQMFMLLETVVKKYSVVALEDITTNVVNDGVHVLILKMKHVHHHPDVIGDPSVVKKPMKRSPVDQEMLFESNKKVSTNDIRHRFRHLSDDSTSKISNQLDRVPTKVYKGCENCSNIPCDWTEFGLTIIDHLNEDYFGRLVDKDGNVIEEYEEGTTDLITNKQLRFLAYSAYTSLKHGFLGKKKRIPIPHCVECGIHLHFLEKSKCYVGFRHA